MAKHKDGCRRAFGRYDKNCPRCQELMSGAEPIRWRGVSRAEEERRQIAAIRAHDCKQSGCGPVCTFGDW